MSEKNTNQDDTLQIMSFKKNKSQPDIVSTNANDVVKENAKNNTDSIDDIDILDFNANKSKSSTNKDLNNLLDSINKDNSELEDISLTQLIKAEKELDQPKKRKRIPNPVNESNPVSKPEVEVESKVEPVTDISSENKEVKTHASNSELNDLLDSITSDKSSTSETSGASGDTLSLTKLLNIEKDLDTTPVKENIDDSIEIMNLSSLKKSDDLPKEDAQIDEPVNPIEEAQEPVELQEDINDTMSDESLDDELESLLDDEDDDLDKPKKKKSSEPKKGLLDNLKNRIFVEEDTQETKVVNTPAIEDTADNSYNDTAEFTKESLIATDEYDTQEFDDLKEDNFFKSKKFLILIIIIVLLIIALVGVGLYLLFAKPKSFEVTNFVGKEKLEAEKFCEDYSLDEQHCLFTLEYSETVEDGYITAQSIDAGKKMKKSDTITFNVSQGKDPDYEVTLADFTNMKESEIEKWFEDNDFTNVTFEYKVDATKEDESFASINTTKTSAKRSEALVVTIYLKEAKAGTEFEVPDFTNYTKANIQAWGTQNKITIAFVEEYSDSIATGSVITQDKKAGSKVKVGDKITITLSKGKAIIMNDYVGKTKEEAQSYCNVNSLKCDFSTSLYSSTEKGKISAQSVAKNTNVTSATTIKFTISLGSEVTIGDYKNKSYDDFESQINALNKLNANLTISKSTKTTNNKEQNNLVVENLTKTTINNKVTVTYYVYEAANVKVPNCSGSESSYTKSLTDLGLKASKQGERYSSESSGNVTSCSVSGGNSVTEGTTITYYVSKGSYNPSANDFNNKTKANTQSIINTAVSNGASGWTITFTESYNNSVPAGTTYGCSISGKTVACNLSKGSKPTVKNYVGGTWTATTGQYNDGNVTLKLQRVDSNKPYNEIINQSVAAGTEYEGSLTVILSASNGPAPNMSAGNDWTSICSNGANSCIYNTYYNVTKTEEYSDSIASGKIISGSCNGSECNVVVSKGTAPITSGTFSMGSTYWTGTPYGSSIDEVKSKLSNAFPNYNITVTGQQDTRSTYSIIKVVINNTTYESEFSIDNLEYGTTINVYVATN